MAKTGRPRIHDYDLIRVMVVEGGLTHREVAEQLGISTNTVAFACDPELLERRNARRNARRNGLTLSYPPKKMGRPRIYDHDLLRAMVEGGLTQVEVAEQLGISRETVFLACNPEHRERRNASRRKQRH